MKSQLFYLAILIGINSFCQNTVGVLKNDPGSYNGYTLFSPLHSPETYLINNCGQIINQWTSSNLPAASVYLLENGNLLSTVKVENNDITLGGVGGKIELYNWDGILLWEYTYSSSLISQHHDIYPLPNGNILMLAVTTLTELEAIELGRDPLKLVDGKLYNEQIIELEPIGNNQANIVWEWNIKDHLVQDYDNTKSNFGVISENPQLLNINYEINNDGFANWLHINSIQYNEELDQIVLSTRNLCEIYIIDHSTTTSEAASHTGGTYGKGGDFLFRYGNPESYDKGTSANRTLFGQHYPHWIPDDFTDAKKILIFNNGETFSSIDIIDPIASPDGFYTYNNEFSPNSPEWSYSNSPNFFSSILSSAQRLPNGNTLICEGASGNFFEIDNTDTIVWEYINPDTKTGITTQGDTPDLNSVFRAIRFPESYAAFNGRDLTPTNPIELDFDISSCNILSIDEFNISDKIELYPNPTEDIININSKFTIEKIEVYNMYGEQVKTFYETNEFHISSLASGLYLIKVFSKNKIGIKKVVKL